VVSRYGTQGRGSIAWTITNLANAQAEVSVLDAYTGKSASKLLQSHQSFADQLQLDQFGGWYDLIVKVSGDVGFKYQLAGHVETGKDSISDPALGGLVTLKG
jgi:phospholipase C